MNKNWLHQIVSQLFSWKFHLKLSNTRSLRPDDTCRGSRQPPSLRAGAEAPAPNGCRPDRNHDFLPRAFQAWPAHYRRMTVVMNRRNNVLRRISAGWCVAKQPAICLPNVVACLWHASCALCLCVMSCAILCNCTNILAVSPDVK